METWSDQAIILSVKHHGENGAIAWVLTQDYGLQTGYVRGARGSKMRGTIEIGNHVDARWQSRNEDSLGTFMLELVSNSSAAIMHDPVKLSALQSACALCRYALPEKETSLPVYDGLQALFKSLSTDIWAEAYIFWEIALLRELGFSLDLSTCAGGGEAEQLAYVSPKTGRAVSAEKGEPYAHKLLRLPECLGGIAHGDDDILTALTLTAYFFEHWVFNHHSRGVPAMRLRFQERFEKTVTLIQDESV